MFIELIDSMRCIADHEETWLVAAITRMSGRQVVGGTLGCPICRAEYPIVDGVAFFSGLPTSRLGDTPDAGSIAVARLDDERVTRVAALLDLTEPGGVILLGGALAVLGPALVDLAGVRVIALNPGAGLRADEGVSVLRVGDRVPLAANAIRAAALDPSTASRELLTGIVRAIRQGGRLLAPAILALPPEVTELARDTEEWVGVRELSPTPPIAIALHPRRGP